MTRPKEHNENVPEPQSTVRNSQDADRLGTIRVRAYELYEERLQEAGHADEDWLRAEAEISARGSEPKGPDKT